MDKCLLEKIEKDMCYAVIPARGGSKSVPGKNIRLFEGHPLIAWSIAAGKLAEKVSRVIVSTDSHEIAETAGRYGAETPFLRPARYAQDDSPDIDFIRHLLEWLYTHERKIPEYLIHLRPTTPLRNPAHIDEALRMIQKDKTATSLRSGSICAHPPFKWFKKEHTYLTPLMEGMTCDEVNLPRQDFPEVYIPNGYVDIIKPDFVIRTGLLHGDRMVGYRTQEVPDIDTELDMRKLALYNGLEETVSRLKQYMEEVQEKDQP